MTEKLVEKLRVAISEEHSTQPLYATIAETIRLMIDGRELLAGDRLPTNRELSRQLKLDRSTVSRAYLELSNQQLLDSHVGRGTFVRSGSQPKSRLSGRDSSRIDGETDPLESNAAAFANGFSFLDKFSQSSASVLELTDRQPAVPQSSNVISFAGGMPTDEQFPADEFESIVMELVSTGHCREMFGYSPANGHPLLIEQLIRMLESQDTAVDAKQLLIVNGSQQGIDLVFDTFLDPGDLVAIEEPTYFWGVCNLKARQSRLMPVPTDDGGMRVEVLAQMLERHKPKMIYVMPNYQNPTGGTLSMERRRLLVQLALEHQIPILEDNFAFDLRYEGDPLQSLLSMAGEKGNVIHLGTFSKSLCPGLRLGWLAGPEEAMHRLVKAQTSGRSFIKLIEPGDSSRILEKGLYEHHLEKVRAIYRTRRDAMLQALQSRIAPVLVKHGLGRTDISWTQPKGGLFIWLRLPLSISARVLLQFAEREAVSFTPGDLFFTGANRQQGIRLCFIHLK